MPGHGWSVQGAASRRRICRCEIVVTFCKWPSCPKIIYVPPLAFLQSLHSQPIQLRVGSWWGVGGRLTQSLSSSVSSSSWQDSSTNAASPRQAVDDELQSPVGGRPLTNGLRFSKLLYCELIFPCIHGQKLLKWYSIPLISIKYLPEISLHVLVLVCLCACVRRVCFKRFDCIRGTRSSRSY